jgi:hypothetical protein
MILGSRRGRRGAELKVMSAVEHKTKGFYVGEDKKLRNRLDQVGDGEGDGFGYDVFPFEPDEFSYALGAQVSLRSDVRGDERLVFFSRGPPLRFFSFPPARRERHARRSDRSIRSLSRSAEVSPTRRAITQLSRERRQSLWFADVFWPVPAGSYAVAGCGSFLVYPHIHLFVVVTRRSSVESRSVFFSRVAPLSPTHPAHARATPSRPLPPPRLLRSSRRARRVRSSRLLPGRSSSTWARWRLSPGPGRSAGAVGTTSTGS